MSASSKLRPDWGTPTSTAVPPPFAPSRPGRTARRIWPIVTSRPMQSKAKSTPLPGSPKLVTEPSGEGVSARICSIASPPEALTPCVAPNLLANSSFSSSRSTAMIGSALTTLAATTAERPTPPTPKTATLSPSRTAAVL